MREDTQLAQQTLTPAKKPGEQEHQFNVMVDQVYDGPLDLLLDLIRKQDIDIYDIPIAKITAQFLQYVERMKKFDVDVAAEFIYTASLLIHIKSKLLLPRDADAAAKAADRRRRLVEPGAQGIQGRRGHRSRTRRRRHRPGQSLPADHG